jgi:peptidyl-prolyl cis-trans isomerase SurA
MNPIVDKGVLGYTAGVSLLLLTALGADAVRAQQAGTLDYIVAVVDENVVTATELGLATQSAAQQLQAQGTALPPQQVLQRQVLERLIVGHLQSAAADRAGIQVDDQTLNSALSDIARRNEVSLEVLRQTIESEGYSYESFRDDIRQDLVASRLRERMVNSRIQVTDQEVEEFLTLEGELDTTYRLYHILIGVPEGASPEIIARSQAKASEVLQTLRNGADFRRTAAAVSDGANALDGGDIGWRDLAQIPPQFAEVVRDMEVGEVSDLIRSPSGFHILRVEEVRSGGQRLVDQVHARHILIRTNEIVTDEEARLRLDRLRSRILNGESFADLARANSDDSASAVKGGDLGWASPNSFVPQFEEMLASLPVNQISPPFESSYGWHIVEALERRRHDSTEDYLRTQAREALFRRKADEEWELWLRRLRDEAYVEYRLSG